MRSFIYLKIRAILIPAMGMALLMSGCAPKPVKKYPEVTKEISPGLFDQAENGGGAGGVSPPGLSFKIVSERLPQVLLIDLTLRPQGLRNAYGHGRIVRVSEFGILHDL